MTETVVLAEIIAEQGQDALVRDAVAAPARASQRERGCQRYEVFTAPGKRLIYEIWRDAEALAEHGQTPHIAAYKAAVAGKAKISVQKFYAT